MSVIMLGIPLWIILAILLVWMVKTGKLKKLGI